MSVGSRNHFCPGSQVYRDHVAAVVQAPRRSLRRPPGGRRWHVGNEFGRPAATCAPTACAPGCGGYAHYRRRARRRVGDGVLEPALLPARRQVVPRAPRPTCTTRPPVPRLLRWFTSGPSLRDVHRLQVAIIRERSDAPVTTNWRTSSPVDQHVGGRRRRRRRLLHRPAGGPVVARLCCPGPRPRPRRRRGEPWLLMEQAAGAVEPGARTTCPRARARWSSTSLRAVAHGADGVCYFQWRVDKGAERSFHSAAVPHAGPDTDLHRAVRAQGALLQRPGPGRRHARRRPRRAGLRPGRRGGGVSPARAPRRVSTCWPLRGVPRAPVARDCGPTSSRRRRTSTVTTFVVVPSPHAVTDADCGDRRTRP